MPQAGVEHGEATHRQPDQVGPLDLEMVEHRQEVGHGVLLRVLRRVGGHVRRRVAASVIGDAPVAPREMPHLGLPAAVVARELVHEDDGDTFTGVFVVEADAVGGQRGHGPASVAMARQYLRYMKWRATRRSADLARAPAPEAVIAWERHLGGSVDVAELQTALTTGTVAAAATATARRHP